MSIEVPSGFRRLQRGLTGERTLIGHPYMDQPELLEAYLGYYWPVSRAQGRHVLAHPALNQYLPAPGWTAIDAGSGPGPLACAWAEGGCSSVCLIDRSRSALDLAERIIPERMESPSGTPVPEMIRVPGDFSRLEPEKIPFWGAAHLVSFGHCINEVYSEIKDSGIRIKKKVELFKRWASALIPGGFFVVIEPALLETSRELLAVRDQLVAAGWRIIAPCPGRQSLPCPALAAGPAQTCHEEFSWVPPVETERMAGELGLDKNVLKMCWFALQPPQGTSSESDFGENSRCALPVENPEGEYMRVVSEPMLNKGGRFRRLVCSHRGRLPLSVSASSPLASSSGFLDLRRGELILLESPEQRESGWGVDENTTIIRFAVD